ncbi:MAG TPA: hypothetical protein VI306_09045 [Pyrinomonadaceae bacterium]
MIDFKEITTGEIWELFARDFLEEMGFFIESSPDRGADGGKDALMSEELIGLLGRYRFRWLVSCKHNAVSGTSVNETDEPNILERIESFDADGFMGFYSTVPSSALNTRLNALRKNQSIKDFRIFDHQVIENHLVSVGFSTLLMRYFPESYKLVKPLHLIANEYVPLKCKICGKDLLEALYKEEYEGVIAFAKRTSNEGKIMPAHVEDVYWACKGQCDRLVESRYWERDSLICSWADISDLVIPTYFLRFVFDTMNSLKLGNKTYSDEAYEKLKTFMTAISQKVLRETTGRETDRVRKLIDMASLNI